MQIDKYGRAYTDQRMEAIRYRVIDNDQYSQQQGYTKYVNFFTYDKPRYVLPVSLGKPVSVTNEYEIPIMPGLELMGFQKQTIARIESLKIFGEKSGMVVSDVGTGKSYILLGIINLFKRKSVVVVPTKNIAKGLYEKFNTFVDCKVMTSSQIEKAEALPDVLITTAQSMNKAYAVINDNYDLLLIDEIHFMPKKRIEQINKWKGLFVCGLTATPQRKEYGIEGFKILFKNIYDTGVKSLETKVYYHDFQYNYSLAQIEQAGEGLSPESPEIYRRLYTNNPERLVELGYIIKKLREKGFKKMIIFTDRVAHAEKIKEYLGEGYLMTGATKARDFKDQDEYIIIGMMQCSGVGFDVPELEVGILYMSSSWTNTVEQSAGRVRRKFDGKEYAVYIDFIDSMKFAGSKVKRLGRYNRHKIYKEKNREVLPFHLL